MHAANQLILSVSVGSLEQKATTGLAERPIGTRET
jgi:hypothetical protein